MSFAFVCQHNSFIVFKSLQQRSMKNWQLVAKCSVGVSFSLCLLLGIAGYLAFLEATQGDILNNFPATGVAVNAARALLAFTMLFTYPLECYVTRHCLMSIIDRWMMRRESQRKWSQRVQDDDAVELTNVGLSRSPISSTDSPPPPHTHVIDRVENGDSNTFTAVEGKKNSVTQLPVKSDRAQSNIPVKPEWLQSNHPVKSDRAHSHISVKPEWPQSNSIMQSDSNESEEGGGEGEWTVPPSNFLENVQVVGIERGSTPNGITSKNQKGDINKNGVITENRGRLGDNKWTWGMGPRMFSQRWYMIKVDEPPGDNYIPHSEISAQQSSVPALSSRQISQLPLSLSRSSSSSQPLPSSSFPPPPPSSSSLLSSSSSLPASSSSLPSSHSFIRRTVLTLVIWGTSVGLALAFDDLGTASSSPSSSLSSLSLSYFLWNQPTLPTHPLYSSCQPILLTHCINPSCQPIYQPILSFHPLTSPSHHTLSPHSLTSPFQSTLSKPPSTFCFTPGVVLSLTGAVAASMLGYVQICVPTVTLYNNTRRQYTLWTSPLYKLYQINLSTYPINIPYQYTLSIHLINNPCWTPFHPPSIPASSPSTHRGVCPRLMHTPLVIHTSHLINTPLSYPQICVARRVLLQNISFRAIACMD